MSTRRSTNPTIGYTSLLYAIRGLRLPGCADQASAAVWK
jgi:hypothetical protein